MTIKSLLASSFQAMKITPLLLELQQRFIPGGYIRAINYHGVSAETAGNFERQLAYYAERFNSVSLADLDNFFQLKRWDKKRPGLIISFDDGLSSNYSVAAPLLDKCPRRSHIHTALRANALCTQSSDFAGQHLVQNRAGGNVVG